MEVSGQKIDWLNRQIAGMRYLGCVYVGYLVGRNNCLTR